MYFPSGHSVSLASAPVTGTRNPPIEFSQVQDPSWKKCGYYYLTSHCVILHWWAVGCAFWKSTGCVEPMGSLGLVQWRTPLTRKTCLFLIDELQLSLLHKTGCVTVTYGQQRSTNQPNAKTTSGAVRYSVYCNLSLDDHDSWTEVTVNVGKPPHDHGILRSLRYPDRLVRKVSRTTRYHAFCGRECVCRKYICHRSPSVIGC